MFFKSSSNSTQIFIFFILILLTPIMLILLSHPNSIVSNFESQSTFISFQSQNVCVVVLLKIVEIRRFSVRLSNNLLSLLRIHGERIGRSREEESLKSTFFYLDNIYVSMCFITYLLLFRFYWILKRYMEC